MAKESQNLSMNKILVIVIVQLKAQQNEANTRTNTTVFCRKIIHVFFSFFTPSRV